jgi:hypothetical protein
VTTTHVTVASSLVQCGHRTLAAALGALGQYEGEGTTCSMTSRRHECTAAAVACNVFALTAVASTP